MDLSLWDRDKTVFSGGVKQQKYHLKIPSFVMSIEKQFNYRQCKLSFIITYIKNRGMMIPTKAILKFITLNLKIYMFQQLTSHFRNNLVKLQKNAKTVKMMKPDGWKIHSIIKKIAVVMEIGLNLISNRKILYIDYCFVDFLNESFLYW